MRKFFSFHKNKKTKQKKTLLPHPFFLKYRTYTTEAVGFCGLQTGRSFILSDFLITEPAVYGTKIYRLCQSHFVISPKICIIYF